MKTLARGCSRGGAQHQSRRKHVGEIARGLDSRSRVYRCSGAAEQRYTRRRFSALRNEELVSATLPRAPDSFGACANGPAVPTVVIALDHDHGFERINIRVDILELALVETTRLNSYCLWEKHKNLLFYCYLSTRDHLRLKGLNYWEFYSGTSIDLYTD